MNSHLYGILDGDSAYSRLFANYLNNLSRLKNNFLVFTDVDSLFNFKHKDELQILFLDEAFDVDEISRIIDLSHIVILSESSDTTMNRPCPCILKYDSPETILTRALNLLSAEILPKNKQNNSLSFFENIINEDTIYHTGTSKFLGIYSPYSLDLQTFFALCAGFYLSNSSSVLFLDLSRFSPINSRSSKSGFSDLIFYYRSNKEILFDKLHTITDSYNNFDYVAPPRTGEDISAFPKDVFSSCLEFLADRLAYNYIIINLGDYLTPFHSYLDTLHRLFVPYNTNANSVDKLYSYLHHSGLSQMVPSVTGLEMDYKKPINYDDASDISALATKIKTHHLFHQVSDFVSENIVKGGLSDDRSNTTKSTAKGRYLL